MPSNWLYIDTNFPSFTQQESTGEKIETMQDYLFMLVEQLRYTLRNLDLSNMNKAAADGFVKKITQPIYAEIKNAKGSITQLSLTANGLAARISDAEGNITQLGATAEGLAARISNAEGNITQLGATAEGLSGRISDAEGNITTLTATAEGLRTQVSGKIDSKAAQTLITQNLNKITLGASSGKDGTIFTISKDGVQIASTGTVDLHVKSVNIDGALTIGQLPNTVAQTSQIPTMTSQLLNNSGFQTEQGVTQIIGGVVTTDFIYALGVEASAVRGSTVAIKNNGGNTVGGITTTWTESGSDGIAIISTTGLKIGAQTNLFLSAGSGGSITLKNGNMIMSGLALCLSPQSYGYGAPSGAGVAGQIYVQLRQ